MEAVISHLETISTANVSLDQLSYGLHSLETHISAHRGITLVNYIPKLSMDCPWCRGSLFYLAKQTNHPLLHHTILDLTCSPEPVPGPSTILQPPGQLPDY